MPATKETRRRNDKRKRHESANIGQCPAIENKSLREACRDDLLLWHREVFKGSSGLKPLGECHVQSEELAQHCILKGGRIARALPRGIGKTTLAINAVLWMLCYSHRRFVAMFGSSQLKATELMGAIKFELTENDVLFSIFPEVCHPFRALEGFGVKGFSQHIDGQQTNVRWKADQIVFASVEGSECSGNVAMVRPISNARGMSHKIEIESKTTTIRPDFVMLDDIVRDVDADSKTANDKILNTVKKSILRLGGHSKSLSVLANGTVIQKNDAFEQILNDPSWNTIRFKLLSEPSEREDLWLGEYAKIRQDFAVNDGINAQLNARLKSLEFYKANRELMDANCKVAWDWAYEWGDDPQTEISAIQHAYNILIDDGPEVFAAEMQNEPLEKDSAAVDEERLAAEWFSSKIGNLERGVCATETAKITAAIDVGKYELHWVVVGWSEDVSARILDYGVELVGSKRDDEEGVEFRIQNGISRLVSGLRNVEFDCQNGSFHSVDAVYVDAGYKSETVYREVSSLGGAAAGVFSCMGTGDRLTPGSLKRLSKSNANSRSRTFLKQQSRLVNNFPLMLIDSAFWRGFVRDRFATGISNTGSMRLFKPDYEEFGDHKAIGLHLANEWQEPDGKWKQNSRNHWSDCLTYASAAAARVGIRIYSSRQQPTVKRRKRKLSDAMNRRKRVRVQ